MDFETMSLPELAERLEDLDGKRTPVGWTPEDAVLRASIERCILALIGRDAGEGDAIPCPLDVQLRSKERVVAAHVRALGVGGVWVETDDAWIVGTHVELTVHAAASDEHGLRVRGVIVGYARGAARISIAAQPSEAHERRLRRFVLELIRHRVHN